MITTHYFKIFLLCLVPPLYLNKLNDFPDKKANNIIILITDGAEECKGNPCAVSQELQDNGIILKPFIIGIGLTEEVLKTYQCVGTYYNSNTEPPVWSGLKNGLQGWVYLKTV